MQNRSFLARYQAWVRALPAPLKALYYALEVTVLGAISVFALNWYNALTTGAEFSWSTQTKLFELTILIGALKAFIDLIKAISPAPPPAQ